VTCDDGRQPYVIMVIRVAEPALNLLSVVAALGAITALFTSGWSGSLLGLSGTGPVDAFLPVVMFSVLFGLSMDYEVYTVSRMHEEWRRLRSSPEGAAWRNHAAVTAGQVHSTRIVRPRQPRTGGKTGYPLGTRGRPAPAPAARQASPSLKPPGCGCVCTPRLRPIRQAGTRRRRGPRPWPSVE
jgi:hypothetical protein